MRQKDFTLEGANRTTMNDTATLLPSKRLNLILVQNIIAKINKIEHDRK